MNFYNEIDKPTAAWLRELIAEGLIPDGYVDERSITDIKPHELDGFIQHHFFAGVAGWPLALRMAGWPDSRPVWTGSCPCQPYSTGSTANGGAKGPGDCRDLWPDFFRLIEQRGASTVLGEQVESAIKWGWWDRAALDLETASYSVAAAVLRADTFGAVHQRKRLYWMAHAGSEGRQGHQPDHGISRREVAAQSLHGDPLVGARRALDGDFSDLLPCDGLSVVMERHAVKGYGNAIVPQVAATFIQATIEALAA